VVCGSASTGGTSVTIAASLYITPGYLLQSKSEGFFFFFLFDLNLIQNHQGSYFQHDFLQVSKEAYTSMSILVQAADRSPFLNPALPRAEVTTPACPLVFASVLAIKINRWDL